jgi:hypothetical protein
MNMKRPIRQAMKKAEQGRCGRAPSHSLGDGARHQTITILSRPAKIVQVSFT